MPRPWGSSWHRGRRDLASGGSGLASVLLSSSGIWPCWHSPQSLLGQLSPGATRGQLITTSPEWGSPTAVRQLAHHPTAHPDDAPCTALLNNIMSWHSLNKVGGREERQEREAVGRKGRSELVPECSWGGLQGFTPLNRPGASNLGQVPSAPQHRGRQQSAQRPQTHVATRVSACLLAC